MNIEYLSKEVIPQRREEIENGDNLATAQPIYVVLDLIEKVAFGHVEISSNTNLAEKDPEEGYVDMDPEIETEDREFYESDEGMIVPAPITRFWIDRPIAFFLTSLAAHNYKKYQAHNLTDPYVYVFHSGYGNRQMDNLLNDDHKSYKDVYETGINLIAEERKRQINEEKWSAEHDDKHTEGELALAAVCYTLDHGYKSIRRNLWPFNIESFKPTRLDRIRELEKAGALIAAEIDRLQRY